MSTPLLEVENLSMHYDTLEGNVDAVKNISFTVNSGESFGLVGESGCGKTSVAMTLLQLQPENSVITQGSIKLDGKELIGLSENDLRKVRWDSISIVFQGAMNAWNPVIKIGEQIREAMREHYPENTKQENINKIIELFRMVGLDESITDRYPHELSGGQKQRVCIARAIALEPSLLILDEPTSALDVSVQSQILEFLASLQKDLNLTYLFISHNLSVVRYLCQRVGVMYLGKIIEEGTTKKVFEHPRHPYTKALLGAIPYPGATQPQSAPPLIGDIPSPVDLPVGCRFHTRCPEKIANLCDKLPPGYHRWKSGWASCHLFDPELNKAAGKLE